MPEMNIQIERLTEASERGFTAPIYIWVLRVGCLGRLLPPGCFIPSIPEVSLGGMNCSVGESHFSESDLSWVLC